MCVRLETEGISTLMLFALPTRRENNLMFSPRVWLNHCLATYSLHQSTSSKIMTSCAKLPQIFRFVLLITDKTYRRYDFDTSLGSALN